MPSQVKKSKPKPTPDEDNAEINRIAIEAYGEYRATLTFTDDADKIIPTTSVYEGIGLENHKPDVLAQIVRPCVSEVLATADVSTLKRILRDRRWAPESRMLACMKLQAIWDRSVDNRTRRPDIDEQSIQASLSALNYGRGPTQFEGDVVSGAQHIDPPHMRQTSNQGDQTMCVRESRPAAVNLAELLANPKPRAVVQAQKVLQVLRKETAETDILHIDFAIVIRDRLDDIRKLTAEPEFIGGAIGDLIDGIDKWLHLHRGQE